MTRVARTRNRTDRHNGYDGGEADDAPKDPFEGSSSTTVQHVEDGAAAPGLFRRRLAGLVVINGAMVAEWMEGKRKTKATAKSWHIFP